MNRFSFAAFAALTVVYAYGAGKCDLPPNSGTDFGRFVDFQRPISAAKPLQIDARPNSRYMRINLTIRADAPKDWTLRSYDLFGRPLWATNAAMIGAARQFWSARLPWPSAKLAISADNYDAPVLDTVGYMEMSLSGAGQYYSLKQANAPDWQDLYGRSNGGFKTGLGESVGMLIGTYGTNATGHPTWTCSGVIIAAEPKILFLTAAHCGAPDDYEMLSWSDDITGRMIVDLSWDGDAISRDYRVERGPQVYKAADVAVLTLVPLDFGAPPKKAVLRDQPPTDGEHLFIIHHPESQQKKISENCVVEHLEEVAGMARFHHQCDTESGSSGAPVFDTKGAIVGMHVTGYEKMSTGACDRSNKAISSKSILSLLSGSAHQ